MVKEFDSTYEDDCLTENETDEAYGYFEPDYDDKDTIEKDVIIDLTTSWRLNR